MRPAPPSPSLPRLQLWAARWAGLRDESNAPSAAIFDTQDITVIFAGYHTQKPKNGLGDYGTIGRFSLQSSQAILASSADTADDQ
jgi:hypothetical protein